MSIRGFELNKGTTGASSQTEDNISGLIASGPAVATVEGGATGVVIGVVYPLTKPKDAEALGIDAAYDTTNAVRVYRHISEFYRMAGEGTKLYLVVGDQADTMSELIDTHAQALVIASGGLVSYISVAYNPAVAYEPVIVDGLEEHVRGAIATAQALHEWSWSSDRPVVMILEGRGFSGTGATALDLRNILVGAALLEATHVVLCIGQDWDFAETQNAIGQKFADVGTLMGTKAAISVNRSVGEVETLDISSATRGRWLTAGLSSHEKIEAVEDDLSDLDSKGYVFGLSYTGITGLRWNNDHVCSPEGVDDDGFIKISTLGHAATINKAARLLRKKLLPKLKLTVPVDSSTGYLPVSIRKYFENLADVAFSDMAKLGEITDGASAVDPLSQLLSGEKELRVSFIIVPTATIGKIKGTLNLKTTL
jgi:hypothetical protein